ncbi:MAG: hypothetical protein ACRCS9_08790 [Hyphomicrobium sp.]
MFQRTFNLDAGGSGAAPAAGGAAAAGAAAGAQGGEPSASPSSLSGQLAARAEAEAASGQPAQGAASAPFHPENLPDDFRGKSDKETIEKLWSKIAEAPKPPEKDADYKFEPTPEFVKSYGDLKNDPLLPVFQKIAHKHGLDQGRFNGIVQDVYQEFEKSGLIDGPIDANAEVEKLAGKNGPEKDRWIKAHQRVAAVEQFVKTLQTRGDITKQDAMILSSMASSADAVIAFEKVMKLIPAEHGLQGGGNAPQQQVSEHERQMRAMFPSMAKAG